MVKCKTLSKCSITFLLTLFALLERCNSVLFVGGLSESRSLVCLCNDNHHCIRNKLTLESNFVRNSSKRYSIPIGRCETSRFGRCYTVKEVNLDAIKPSRFKRRRKSLLNDSGVTVSIPSSHGKDRSQFMAPKLSNVTAAMFIRIRFGCLPPDERTTLSCNSHLSNHVLPRAISCCNSSDFCNADNIPKFYHYQDDFDAINSALQNINTRRPENKQKRPLYLNPTLNTGPELLMGGKPVKKAVNEAHSEPHSAHYTVPYTRIIFIVTFVLVIAILSGTLVCVFIVYKRGVQKRRQVVYNPIQWIPNHLKNKKRTHLFNKRVASINNGGKRMSSELHSQKEKTYSELIPQNGPSSHTNSTDSTRTTNYGNDKEVLLPSLYPDLVHQTVSKQVTLLRLLGRGCVSEVWSGRWRGEPVTAKLFTAHNRLADSVWRRAVLLHRSMLLRHQSVQGLMAIDSISWPHQCPPSVNRVMLIAEWLQFGSLNDLMANCHWIVSSNSSTPSSQAGQQRSLVDRSHFQLVRVTNGNAAGEKPLLTAADTDSLFAILLRMAHSLTQGLCFLHTEFVGTRGKPALAHRDLKPANVLIRSDWTCCLADLGLAVRPPPSNLPITQDDLHSLYNRYVNQMAVCTDSEAAPTTISPSVSVQTNNQYPKTSEEPKWDSDNTTGHSTLTGVGSEEMEQCAWWPIGGIQIGTPRYLAPELLANSIDPFCFTSYQKADIYALGVILWEIFTWTLSCCRQQPSNNCPTASSAICGDAVASDDVEHISASVGDRSTIGPMSLPSVCPPSVQDSVCYPPAFQEEWKRRFNTNYDHQNAYTSTTHELQDGISSTMGSREPDIPTMYNLVVTLRLRPKLPQPFALLTCNCKHLCSERAGEVEKDLGIELVSEGDGGRLQPSSRSSAEVADNCPCCTVYNSHDKEVAGPSCSASYSSSSGASSLNDPSPCSTSSNDSVSHQSVCCTRFTKAMSQLFALLPECWSHNPDARLTALRVRKNLQRIADQLQPEPLPPPAHQVRPTPATTSAVVLQAPNANIQQCSSCSSSTTIKGVKVETVA